jgi:Subtilisin inhibitor-like
MPTSTMATRTLSLLSAASIAFVLALVLTTVSPARAVGPTRLEVRGPGGAVSLTCDPAGGTHPDPAGACADVAAAGGAIERIPPLSLFCPTYVDPTPISVTGFWRGVPVSFSSVETNPVCARISHGRVFFY